MTKMLVSQALTYASRQSTTADFSTRPILSRSKIGGEHGRSLADFRLFRHADRLAPRHPDHRGAAVPGTWSGVSRRLHRDRGAGRDRRIVSALSGDPHRDDPPGREAFVARPQARRRDGVGLDDSLLAAVRRPGSRAGGAA